jgi:hypothetical protein
MLLNITDWNLGAFAPFDDLIPDMLEASLRNHKQHQSIDSVRKLPNICHRLVFGQSSPELILQDHAEPSFIIEALHVGDGLLQSALLCIKA